MTDIHELRKLQFGKIKPILDSLTPYSPKLSRANVKIVSELLLALLVELESIENPFAILNMANTNPIIIRINAIYMSMTTEEKHGYEKVIESYLKIIHFLLVNTMIKTWMPVSFIDEYLTLFLHLLKQPQGQLSEEIKHQTVKCISAILPKTYKEDLTRYPLENYKFLTIASECITVLLETIEKAPYIHLRLESLSVLSQILNANIEQVDSLAVILPGVVSKLCKTISQKAEKENHQVMCSSLKVLGDLIKTVMCDAFNDTLVDLKSFEDIVTHHNKIDETQQTNKKMNRAWYMKTKQSLLNVMSQILKIRLYPDWRTRLEFVEFAYKLLSNCARTLDNCIKPLIEMMVLHTDDAYNEVSSTCNRKMQILLTNHTFKDTIMPVLKDDLYEWMIKFPQYMISKDENEKANAMSLITGFILLLKDQASSVLSTVLGRSSDGWMTALEIDKDSLNILEQKKADSFIELDSEGTKLTPIFPKIRFKYLVTDVSNTKMTRVLNVIGKYCDLKTWIHHYMRYISVDNNGSNDPQAAYIILSLLSGAFALDLDIETDVDEWIRDTDDTNDISADRMNLTIITLRVLDDVMDILKNATLTNGKTTALTTNISPFNLDEESGNVLTVCFGLQIIGLAATILEQEYLQDQLITILYPLLAHLGSSNVYIHTYALITLDSIALICGLDSAQELAIQNIDYIINTISQHISVLNDNARVPLVLKALIHVGGYDSIFYLDDSILEIYDALERYNTNDWLCIQLCGVLFEIIQTMEKNLPKISTFQVDEDKSTKEQKGTISPEITSFIENKQDLFGNEDKEHETMEEIGKYFLGRQEKGEHNEVTLEQAIMDQVPMDLPKEEGDETKEETKVPLDREESMAKEIMDKSSHFLTASSPQLRSQMLVLLTSGVSILSKHPQELNQLIYLIWPSIVNRFNDSQNYVVLHAAHLIEKISEVSTDFLSRKFADDLWPRFKVLLRKGITAAIANTITDYSVYSLYHRTQLCLLKTLTRIADHVPLNQPIIKDILEETKYYYHDDLVHEQLTHGCKKLFKALSRQQPDTVWLYEVSLQKQILGPISSLLDSFVIPEFV